MDSLPALPLVLYPSRGKLAAFLGVSVLFVAIGVLMVRNGEPVAGCLCGGFFALLVPVFLISMSRRAAYLRLHSEGFTFSSLYRAHTVAWSDVLEFGVMRTTGKSMVGWNFVAGYARSGGLRKVNQAISGFDAALPDNYGMDVEQLAALMAALAGVHGIPSAEQVDGFQPHFEKAQTITSANPRP